MVPPQAKAIPAAESSTRTNSSASATPSGSASANGNTGGATTATRRDGEPTSDPVAFQRRVIHNHTPTVMHPAQKLDEIKDT